MIFASARRVALGALALAFAACSTSSESASGGGGGNGGAGNGASVAFDDDSVLTLTPKASVDVALHVTGDDAHVTLWLEGDYADASLNVGDVSTSGQRAKVTLHAPAVPATFTLRARVAGAADARLSVSVSASGFAAVHVTSKYDGKRPTPGVSASVFLKSTCADLAAAFAKGQLTDGALAKAGDLASPVTIGSVPAGSHVSVLARIQFYAAGCVDIDALTPGATREVGVAVLDRPVALDKTDLESSFSFAPDTNDAAAWSAMLDVAINQALGVFVPQNKSEAAALLDAMHALVPTASQQEFDTYRTQSTWDTRATTWLGQHTPTMKERASTWMSAGKSDTQGNLVAHLAPGPSDGYATVTLTSLGALSPSSAGIAVTSPFAWSADPADVVHLAGVVHAWPTALACSSGDARAALAVSGATDVPSALASQIDCNGLATALVGAGVSYQGCVASCTASLCRQSLAAMWTAARSASAQGGDDLPIGITASAPAVVGDYAEPTSFAGAWVGRIGAASSRYGNFGTKGVAKGEHGQIPR